MSKTRSSSRNRRFGITRVLSEWGIPRSTFYDHRRRGSGPAPPPKRRGPKTQYTDACLTDHIRRVLGKAVFGGEGYRKVWARLRHEGVRAGKPRILRLMRTAGLPAPQRAGSPHRPRVHDGTITTEAPDVMWGIDATATHIVHDGPVTVFVAVDHCASEVFGLASCEVDSRLVILGKLSSRYQARLRGARPTEEALRARAADFSLEKAADAHVALFEKLVRARAR